MSTDLIRAKEIFLQALKCAMGAERDAFLSEACGTDVELRRHVDILIDANDQAGSFLQGGAIAAQPTIDQPITEKPGTQIGPYKLLQQIGEGGMGMVFMAEQKEPVKRRVALKIIKPGMDTRQVIARFEAERQALAMMDHPNIAKVLDAGATESGRPYFVMELVKGTSITEFCDAQKLGMKERLQLFVEVCRAVQHAHQKGIIHRDLKPSNVMVTMRDDRAIPKVIDFGVAKALSQKLTEKTVYTGYGQLVGTPLYMSPEQAQANEVDVDTRSDVYSLGILLYELLTGTTPFDGETIKQARFDELRRIIREDEPPRPSDRISTLKAEQLSTVSDCRKIDSVSLARSLRGELDWIVMKALEKDRNRRYESARAFAVDVERYLNDEPVEACPPSAMYRLRKFVRRNRVTIAFTGVALLFLSTVIGGIGWQARERAARLARTARHAQLLLDDAERLAQEQRWSDALATAKRAEAVLASGEADQVTGQRIAEILNDVEFVIRLDQIRQDRWTIIDGDFNNRGAIEEYAQAFRAYGVDVEHLPTSTAIARLQSRLTVGTPVADALDDWGDARRTAFGLDDSGWKALVAVSRALDPDPLRNHLRDSRGQPVTAELQAELQHLVAGMRVATQRPTTIRALAQSLMQAQLPDTAFQVLKAGLVAHPDDFWCNFELGLGLHARRDYAGAVRYCSIAVSLRPESARVVNNLGIALHSYGKLDEAIACYRKAIALDQGFRSVAHANLGNAFKDQGNLTEAIEEYREAVKLNPKYAIAFNNLGSALRTAGELEGSVAALREAVRLWPDDARAYNNLGCALDELERFEEALDAHRQAIRLDRQSSHQANYNLGNTLVSMGRLEEACDAYREALRLKPDYTTASNNLAIALRRRNLLEEAVTVCTAAIEIDPNDCAVRHTLGTCLGDQGKHAEAEAEYRKAVQLEPDHAGFLRDLGQCLLNQSKLAEAEPIILKAVRLESNAPNGHILLASLLQVKGDPDGSVNALRHAIALNPNNVLAHTNLGVALQKDDLIGAIAAYRQALRLGPDDAVNHFRLGNALFTRGDANAAIGQLSDAIGLKPDYVAAHFALGRALYEQKDLDGAAAAFRETIRLKQDHREAYIWLGLSLRDQGLLADAIRELRQAVRLDPHDSASRCQLAYVLMRNERWDESLHEIEEAIRLDQSSYSAYQNLGYILEHYQRFGEALAAYRTAHRLADQPDDLHRLQAKIDELSAIKNQNSEHRDEESSGGPGAPGTNSGELSRD